MVTFVLLSTVKLTVVGSSIMVLFIYYLVCWWQNWSYCFLIGRFCVWYHHFFFQKCCMQFVISCAQLRQKTNGQTQLLAFLLYDRIFLRKWKCRFRLIPVWAITKCSLFVHNLTLNTGFWSLTLRSVNIYSSLFAAEDWENDFPIEQHDRRSTNVTES